MGKKLDIIRLFKDFNVPFVTEGHKHCTRGWVNTHCPYCSGSQNYHLGYDLEEGFFSCWRCGGKPLLKTLSILLNVRPGETREIVNKYGGYSPRSREEPKVKIQKHPLKYPTGTTALSPVHKRYLKRRGFDPNEIAEIWGILGTGPMSLLGVSNYSHRILAPIYWEGEVVSFQARDVTGKHALKYKACPEIREKIHHKHILYRAPNPPDVDYCICVEGITDAWRLGPLAVATFGIKYTPQQVRALAQLFKKVVVIFDDEPQAIAQAEKLVSELRFRGIRSIRVPIIGDPGGLAPEEAQKILEGVEQWDING